MIPALAVARELRSRGHQVFFVGTEKGLESRLVPAEGFPLKRINIGGLNRVGLQQRLSTLLRLPVTTVQCLGDGPAAVFSMGGYVAGPPVMAAVLRRTPLVIMEPNAVPGFTNRIIGRFVSRALISFPETAAWFPKGRTETTGLPVREEFFRIPAKARVNVLQILVTGGSQGSRTLNQAARESWPFFRSARVPVRLVMQTGQSGYDRMRDDFAASGLEGEVLPFITDMPAAFAAADLVICRSGAGAVSELAAAGKPSILVPFPFAADDHQTRNAEAMANAGAACMLRDAELTGDRLVSLLLEEVSAGLERMGDAARQLARPRAAARAAEILEEEAAGRR